MRDGVFTLLMCFDDFTDELVMDDIRFIRENETDAFDSFEGLHCFDQTRSLAAGQVDLSGFSSDYKLEAFHREGQVYF
ncbi:MAG: hypothetical protein ACMUEL_03530 [Flavobacteriales bacterium Tduv]